MPGSLIPLAAYSSQKFMLLWIAILLLIDSSLALWFERRIKLVLPRWNINVLALMEAAVAVLLIALHFGLI